MAITKMSTSKNVGEGVEKRELFCTLGRNKSWCSHCGKEKGEKKEKKRKQSSGQNKVIFLKNQTNTKLVMSNVSN